MKYYKRHCTVYEEGFEILRTDGHIWELYNESKWVTIETFHKWTTQHLKLIEMTREEIFVVNL